MMKNWKTAFGTAIVCLLAAQAQAGAIDALKQFNSDADGISGNFTQTVRARNKNQTASGTFQILRPLPLPAVFPDRLPKPLPRQYSPATALVHRTGPLAARHPGSTKTSPHARAYRTDQDIRHTPRTRHAARQPLPADTDLSARHPAPAR